MDSEQILKNYIQSICKEFGYFVIEVSMQGFKKQLNIKVTVDSAEGINLDECKRVSKEISDIIYRKDLVFGDYRLIVSSPGLDKSLEHDYEFIRNIGKKLTVNYTNEIQETKEILGELTKFENNMIYLKTGKDEFSIPVKNIIKAKIKLKW